MTTAQTKWPHSPEFGPIPTFIEGVYGGSPWLTHVESAVDWLGRRFRVGEKVMYCIGAGRGQIMAIGRVRMIRARETYDYTWDGTSRVKSNTPVGWEIEVQVLTEKTSSTWVDSKRTKPAWVNPHNITALPALEDAS